MTDKTNDDRINQTEDAKLAERLMRTKIGEKIQGMYRTPEQYVTSRAIANLMVRELGLYEGWINESLSNPHSTARNVIEFCVIEFEKREGNAETVRQFRKD
jgi:hypothetical protein